MSLRSRRSVIVFCLFCLITMCCCCVDGHLTLVFCLITMCCCCIDVHLTLVDSMNVLLTIWLSRLVVVLRCLSDLHREHQRSCCFVTLLLLLPLMSYLRAGRRWDSDVLESLCVTSSCTFCMLGYCSHLVVYYTIIAKKETPLCLCEDTNG